MRPAPAPPPSTYRLQFNHRFTFADARNIVAYLDRLGIGAVYASPYLMAQPGSMHGYDICDHTRLNPEVGSESDYQSFVGALREHQLGQLLDFVPNHMGIDPQTNPWWRDVLENGQSSAYAHYFDIDWDPVKPELKGKVLLPILGDQYGLVLERGELRLAFARGGLELEYFDHRLPVNPRTSATVLAHRLELLQDRLGEDDATVRELLSIVTALRNLPAIDDTAPERIAERRREQEVTRERLERLVTSSPAVGEHIDRALAAYNGVPGQPGSFDLLHALLEKQPYRLAFWRTASHEINYRRFFDINTLAALRMEDQEVFDATHSLVARLLERGDITGLRIDHPDGLYDPAQYFGRLQALWQRVSGDQDTAGSLYILAEKILSPGEDLPADWPVAGTTGYQFVNDVNGVLLDLSGERPLRQFYLRYSKRTAPFSDIVYESKKLITRSSLASELNVLAHALNVISEGNRRSRDFTLDSLRALLQEVVACFPVYRTYVSPRGWTTADRERIETAVRRARLRSPEMAGSIFDFLREVLLPRGEESSPDDRRDGYAPGDAGDYRQRLTFSMKVQQFTSPVQAKGLEDTAFYRYNKLISVNEVGGAPARFGRSIAEFHETNRVRRERRPYEMTTTATHDTKLGEDVRARITALSQIPAEWRKAVAKWTRLNTPYRSLVDGELAPDRNDEYRLYQVLVGVWPALGAPPDETVVSRVREYMMKAIKEAKVHTSWVNDKQEYDQATARFVESVLTGRYAARFLASFLPFQTRVARLALANALGQLVLKMASPGVPDFYQGCELWDLRLVDPDNRGDVDFGLRRRLLDTLEPHLPAASDNGEAAATLAGLLEHWEDGRIKLWITTTGLRARRSRPDLFLLGGYEALETSMTVPAELVAFARTSARGAAIAVVPRLVGRIGGDWKEWAAGWGDSVVVLPRGLAGRTWRSVFSGEPVSSERRGQADVLPVARLLAPCPVALLLSEE